MGNQTSTHIRSRRAFHHIINTERRLVMVVFTSRWCRHCQYLMPTIRTLSLQFQHDLVILIVDIDVLYELGDEFHVDYTPKFIVFHNGRIIDEFSGISPDQLSFKVQSLIFGNFYYGSSLGGDNYGMYDSYYDNNIGYNDYNNYNDYGTFGHNHSNFFP